MVILPEDSWASGAVLWSCGRCQRESQLCGTWTPPLASSSPPSHPSPDPLWAPAQQSSSCHRSQVPPPATAGTAHYGSRLHRFRSKRIKGKLKGNIFKLLMFSGLVIRRVGSVMACWTLLPLHEFLFHKTQIQLCHLLCVLNTPRAV